MSPSIFIGKEKNAMAKCGKKKGCGGKGGK